MAHDGDALEQYWTALGYSTTTWAALEFVLDLHVQLIRKHYGGATIESEVPRGLKQTLTFLRRAFNRLDPLKGASAQMTKMLDEVSTISDRRHLVVHGAAIGFVTNDGIPLRRMKGAKTTYVPADDVITVDEIYAIGHATAPIVGHLCQLGIKLKSPFPGSLFEDA